MNSVMKVLTWMHFLNSVHANRFFALAKLSFTFSISMHIPTMGGQNQSQYSSTVNKICLVYRKSVRVPALSDKKYKNISKYL